MPVSGRIASVGGMVATLGLIVALVYYGSQPNYGVLFTDLKPGDAQSIVEKLQTANIQYSLTNGGTTVLVPIERVSELRLQMAGEGVLSGGHVGFDLFDKTSFGATDFAQQVNFRRAVEGELAKTLEGMDEVESARVHVTPKKESVFSEKEENAKASIMVRVRQNKKLTSERVDAIVSLVASSIEGLDPAGISVMDTSGRLLVAAGHNRTEGIGDAGAFQAQLEAKRKFETESALRITSLIEPVVGDNRVRADVAADIDFSQIEQSEENFDPESRVIRSQQTSQEVRNPAQPGANQAVGARANNPATQVGQPGAPATPGAVAGDQRNSSTVNYEIDKVVKKTVGSGGRLNRITVSVVVDHKTVNDVEVARTADELRQIQELVGAAIGIDPNRGDSVVVQTMPFSKPEIEPPGTTSFLEKNKGLVPTFTKWGTLVLIAILLFLFVIRPARRALKAAADENARTKKEMLLTEGEAMEERRKAGNDGVRQLSDSSDPLYSQMMTVSELENQMNEGKTREVADRIETMRRRIAAQTLDDTETVASTMRSWLKENAQT